MPTTDPNCENGPEPTTNLTEIQPKHNLTDTPTENSKDDLKATSDLELNTKSLPTATALTTVITSKPEDYIDTNAELELIHDNSDNNPILPDLNQQQNDLKIMSLIEQEPVIKTKLKINHDHTASNYSVGDKTEINALTSDSICSNNHQSSTITITLAKKQNSSDEKLTLTDIDTTKIEYKKLDDDPSSSNDKIDEAQSKSFSKSSIDKIDKVEDKHENSKHKSGINRSVLDKSTSTTDDSSNAEDKDESLNSSNETESGSIEIEGVVNSSVDINDGNSTSSGEELDESGGK